MKVQLKLATLVTSAALFAALYLNAQRPRFADAATSTTGTPTTPADAAKTYLSLTDSQITGFNAIRQTAQTAAQPILDQLRTKEQALGQAMRATPVDATTIASLQTDINNLRAQLDKIQSDARAQMIATLSTDQQAKLATLTAAAALRPQIDGASMLGLIAGPGPGGPGGFGSGRGKGKGKGGPGPR